MDIKKKYAMKRMLRYITILESAVYPSLIGDV